MANSADPDQRPTDLDLHCLQRQGISRFSRTRVNAGHRKTSVFTVITLKLSNLGKILKYFSCFSQKTGFLAKSLLWSSLIMVYTVCLSAVYFKKQLHKK